MILALIALCIILWLGLGVIGVLWANQWLVYHTWVYCGKKYQYSKGEVVIECLSVLGGISLFFAGLSLHYDYLKMKTDQFGKGGRFALPK